MNKWWATAVVSFLVEGKDEDEARISAFDLIFDSIDVPSGVVNVDVEPANPDEETIH